ncbi:MAG: DEAD/DEAH box helicase [Bacteroidetes bacterium]|nr:DEAD/DEAH box helicase [Bacteroidota bacterium]
MEPNALCAKTLENLGIPAWNELQEKALEAINNHPDTLLLSPTGSGKTLAFLMPVLLRMRPDLPGVQCLVLSPTRELAIQIEKVWQKMATGFKVNTCYGGHPMPTEIKNLSQPPALLIGTPGRILDHITRQTFDLKNITSLVLDEFDKSLALGFQEQMADILKKLPSLEKRILASATNKLVIPKFMGISKPFTLNFTSAKEKSTDRLSLKRISANPEGKDQRLRELLCFIGDQATLIFCNTRESVEQTNAFLHRKGIASAFFHGGMEQLEREKALIRFRNGSTVFLVASDLAARGLDIPEVKYVIHYELPTQKDDFIHRNGRTARMFAEGTAFLLLSETAELPPYLTEELDFFEIPPNNPQPPAPHWATLYISGGKKDKLSKVDIVGFLCQKGQLDKAEIGKIELMDFMSFVAVSAEKADTVVKLVQPEKMKGKKYKIGIAK